MKYSGQRFLYVLQGVQPYFLYRLPPTFWDLAVHYTLYFIRNSSCHTILPNKIKTSCSYPSCNLNIFMSSFSRMCTYKFRLYLHRTQSKTKPKLDLFVTSNLMPLVLTVEHVLLLFSQLGITMQCGFCRFLLLP